MYKVKVTVAASDSNNPKSRYKKLYLEGLFGSKKDACPHAKIKKMVYEEICRPLQAKHLDLVLTFDISISKLKTDFFFTEDKQEISKP